LSSRSLDPQQKRQAKGNGKEGTVWLDRKVSYPVWKTSTAKKEEKNHKDGRREGREEGTKEGRRERRERRKEGYRLLLLFVSFYLPLPLSSSFSTCSILT